MIALATPARPLRAVRARIIGLAASVLATLAGAWPAAATSMDEGFAAQKRCFEELTRGRARDVVCEYPTLLTDTERADLVRLTRGFLQDAHCIVSIRIERARVAQAIFAPDLVFDVPAQPVVCEIRTKDSVIPITGTFAPRIVIRGGAAVEATPNLAEVKGVNSYLAWPVVQYVNRSPGIRAEMLRMINQYRDATRARAEARR